jgi:hypothetical protein
VTQLIFIIIGPSLRVSPSLPSLVYLYFMNWPLSGPVERYYITSIPSLCARVIYRRILQFLIFDRFDSCYRFKVAFHLHVMPAENCGIWYINDGAYQAQHEQGNILQRQFAEHLPLPSRKDSLPVTNKAVNEKRRTCNVHLPSDLQQPEDQFRTTFRRYNDPL